MRNNIPVLSRRDLLLFAAAGLASATEAPSNCYAGPRIQSKRLPGFLEFPFLCQNQKRTVFMTPKPGRPVLLLHEINGMSPACIELATTLAAQNFQVHMALLFGKAPQDNVTVGAFESCDSSWFNCSTGKSSSPVVGWLRGLIRQGIAPVPGVKTGIVGMCLTGGFPVELMSEPQVGAVVMSQPALPMGVGKEAEIDVTPAALTEARKRTDVNMLLLRFECDMISTHARLEALKADFPWLETYEVPCFRGFKALTHTEHAVLTGGQTLNPAEFEKAFDKVVKTLSR